VNMTEIYSKIVFVSKSHSTSIIEITMNVQNQIMLQIKNVKNGSELFKSHMNFFFIKGRLFSPIYLPPLLREIKIELGMSPPLLNLPICLEEILDLV
jgi:hypothetical protein